MEKYENLILFAAPIFIFSIVFEYIWAQNQKKRVFEIRDSITNIFCGLGSQVFNVIFNIVFVSLYFYLQQNYALFKLDASNPLTWIIAFIGVDFIYYWFHRWGHEKHFIWAFHVVHHQSEFYNLSVALRQPWFGALIGGFTNVPLALLGVPAEIIVTSYLTNLLYQYWIHTESIKTLGPLEWIFNTPSHHRVHHGRQRQYLDKNYGGIFIIWDRLFGTFTPETVPVTYGIVGGFPYMDAWAANFKPLKNLFQAVKSNGLWAALTYPGWRKGDKSLDVTLDRELPKPHKMYLFPKSEPQKWRIGTVFSLALISTLYVLATTQNPNWYTAIASIIALISIKFILAPEKSNNS